MAGDVLISAELLAKGIADHLARLIAADVHKVMGRYRDGMELVDAGEYGDLIFGLAKAEIERLRERAGA